jgi:hypothetical protein
MLRVIPLKELPIKVPVTGSVGVMVKQFQGAMIADKNGAFGRYG